MGSVESGRRLRVLRRERGLTLNDLERETGISRSFLGQVEQGLSDISISRLVRLARTYAITLDELAVEAPVDAPVLVVRAGEAPVIDAEGSDVAVLLRHRGPGLTASILSHRPGSELAAEQTSFREALFHVLDGRFAATVGDAPEVQLGRGDTLAYRGPVPAPHPMPGGGPGTAALGGQRVRQPRRSGPRRGLTGRPAQFVWRPQRTQVHTVSVRAWLGMYRRAGPRPRIGGMWNPWARITPSQSGSVQSLVGGPHPGTGSQRVSRTSTGRAPRPGLRWMGVRLTAPPLVSLEHPPGECRAQGPLDSARPPVVVRGGLRTRPGGRHHGDSP